ARNLNLSTSSKYWSSSILGSKTEQSNALQASINLSMIFWACRPEEDSFLILSLISSSDILICLDIVILTFIMSYENLIFLCCILLDQLRANFFKPFISNWFIQLY